ncbi:hypothetical protein OGAPHI_005548 [Ogataea philodendri]|uniref:Uncharacterized protein n=1 Tax=Ogataea philodendri TaxID=1378263 RepID=A0A9P8T111_9ASCO|nr:uncharacterized protein OGAPHI_005548 [Ogataea philodendri]KAH3662298.1 hypothetical protein OGAPHI_005548 [Ogataea philodendri]
MVFSPSLTHTLGSNILTVGVEVDLHHTILDGSVELVVRRSRTTVEDQEQWVLGLCTDLLDGILLVLSQDFWSQDNVTWLVDTVHVTESGSNGEVWRNWSKGFVHGKHSLWLGVQQVLVCALVVDTVLLTTGDTDLHLEPLVQLGHSGETRDKLAFGVVIVAVELPNVHHNLKLSMELGVRVEIVERVEHLVVVIAVAGPYYQKRIAIAGGLDLCNRAVFCDGEKTVGKA